MQETLVRSLGQEDPLEKANILAWEIPRREQTDRLQSMGLHKSQTCLRD